MKAITRNIDKRMTKSAIDYDKSLFDVYSRLLVVRIDLSYKNEHASQMSLKEMKEDYERLMNNRRSKPSLFSNMVGHMTKFEYSPDKGPHMHNLLYFDGHNVQKDAHLSSEIGKYWNENITDGRGIYFNCNLKKDQYDKCGIGMIDYSDNEKREVLVKEVIPYLTKTDQGIHSVKSGNERAFTKGKMPRRKSAAGRPREVD